MSESDNLVAHAGAGGAGESYVLCEIAGATYAVCSGDIEQLEMVGALTPMPNAPAYVDGVTSVRGRVIPAVSLRARFGFPRVASDLRARVVVVRAGSRSVGLIVDSAREFARFADEAIQPAPDALVDADSPYLRGIAHLGDRLVLVLDIAALLRSTTPVLPPPPVAGVLPAGT